MSTAALEVIRAEFPTVTDFERDFPSLCFALATGVGKTRLMGAFISYLHLAHGIDNFFVLAPNLTIYNKLIADFTPGTPKYVFQGIAAFATQPPEIITGDNYQSRAGSLFVVLDPVQGQHLQHLEDQHRGARRAVARGSSGSRSTSARAISIIWRTAGSCAADGRVAPVPGVGGGAGNQRAAGRSWGWS